MKRQHETNPESATRYTLPRESAALWRLPSRTLSLAGTTQLMGIVNVTPDSFSDGGTHVDAGRAVDHALRLIDEGAAIIDIGGESTRPYSQPVSEDEELRRTVPVVQKLRKVSDIPISIDTTKSAVARAAMDAGADIINDVSGLEADPRMVDLAVRTGAALCVMHMRGTPQSMQDNPVYDDVVEEIIRYLENRLNSLISAGIERDAICIDPGIGFGKTEQHNLTLIGNSHCFHRLGHPVLVGHSRKGFIGKRMSTNDPLDRDVGTAAISLLLVQQQIQLLRVHNIAMNQKTLALMRAVPGFLSTSE